MVSVVAQQLLDMSRENCDLKAEVEKWQKLAGEQRARADALMSCMLKIERMATECTQQ